MITFGLESEMQRTVAMRDEARNANDTQVFPSESAHGADDLKLGHLRIKYGYLCKGGQNNGGKAQNKDWFCAVKNFAKESSEAFFAVCDGHGKDGHLCAAYASDRVPRRLAHELKKRKNSQTKPMTRQIGKKTWTNGDVGPSEEQIYEAFSEAYNGCNRAMFQNKDFNATASGTTCTSAYIQGNERRIFIGNVGDSRAVLGRKGIAHPLSWDQTPYRGVERKRIRENGARILSLDQIDGIAPIILGKNEKIPGTAEHYDYHDLVEGEDEESDLRIWHKTLTAPGIAFTRSLGDSEAEKLGVIAEPEMVRLNLEAGDDIIVLASDGVFEFLTNQSVIDICVQCKDDGPLKACEEVICRSQEYWKTYESHVDDMTCIVIFIESIE